MHVEVEIKSIYPAVEEVKAGDRLSIQVEFEEDLESMIGRRMMAGDNTMAFDVLDYFIHKGEKNLVITPTDIPPGVVMYAADVLRPGNSLYLKNR